MTTPEDNESKLQTMEPNNTQTFGVLQDSVGEATSLESMNNTDVLQMNNEEEKVNNEEEKAKWEKIVDVLHRSYEFHLDFALKAVGFFYAILGGILSIYFSGSGRISREVVIVLLGLPILMSIILGSIFLYGGWLWNSEVTSIRKGAEEFKIKIWLKVELLGYALRIFGSLFFIVFFFLIWLITRLDLK